MANRLSRTDWLEHGLKCLASSGATALKAEPLAKSLAVSRGSFYWHFKNLKQFHMELLARWQEATTDDVIAVIEQKNKGEKRLQALMRRALMGDQQLERAVRSWAIENAVAAAAISQVDKRRIHYIRTLLAASGRTDKQAQARATFIYWAYVGRMMLSHEHAELAASELDRLSELMQS